MDGACKLRVFPGDRIGGGHRLPLVRIDRRPRRRQRSASRRLARWLGACVLTALVLSWLAVLPLRWINPPTTAFLLQDDGAEGRLLAGWAAWNEIGGALPIAVVAAEDQRFADHFGFDLSSIRESIDDYSDGDSLRGASTISQQLAKNLYLWPGRSFLRKGIEAYFTLLLEASLSKERILEIYLNVAEFGPGVYGVRAASTNYFDESPAELSDEEAALLAAVLPNPARFHVEDPSEYVQERQAWITDQMQRLRSEGWLDSLH